MCEVRKRVFFYCLITGVVSHILCITLALCFGNALNEAARDADVFRMFSPAGNGFMATKKCENACWEFPLALFQDGVDL